MQGTWKPLAELELQEMIAAAEARMTSAQAHLWAAIRITPAKWVQSPWGDDGGGFWAVAILGPVVIWYNDTEEGLNCSRYSAYGTIDSYLCNQDQLEWTIQQLLNFIETGEGHGQFLGAPEPIPWRTTPGREG